MHSSCSTVRHLPNFSYVRVPSEINDSEVPCAEMDSVSDGMLSTSATSQESVPARGTKRGRDAAKTRIFPEKRGLERDNEREQQLARVHQKLTDITLAIKHKTLVNNIVQALKIATDRKMKEKLQEKLVELALAE